MSRLPSSRIRPKFPLQALAITLMVAPAASIATGVGVASAQEPREELSCPVVAAAQNVRTTVQKAGDVALASPTGADAPAAQACVNIALSESIAYASGAYPGETARTAPGGTADFPAYVSSSHPGQPSADVEEATLSLHARSSLTSSGATARSAPPSTGSGAADAKAVAKTTVDPVTGTATASASSVSTPMALGGVLLLGQVRSKAEVRRRADGAVERTAALEVGRSAVAGQLVTIGPDGVHAAGQVAPLPADDAVADALRAAGVTLSYLAEERTPNGVLSPGLLIRVESEDTSGALTTVEHVIGRALAAAAGVRREPPVAAVPTVPTGAPIDIDPPAGGARSGLAGLAPSGATGGATQQVAMAPSTVPVVSASRGLEANGLGLSFAGIYAVLVVGGLVLVASGTFVRLFGVRTRWIS